MQKMNRKITVTVKRHDSEAQEQSRLIAWANEVSRLGVYPELSRLYAIPNGGRRDKAEAAHLKRQGVKSGVPDLHLPVARGNYHGLYIEMKVGKNKPTKNQKEWINALKASGYAVEVCYSAAAARQVIIAYLQLREKA